MSFSRLKSLVMLFGAILVFSYLPNAFCHDAFTSQNQNIDGDIYTKYESPDSLLNYAIRVRGAQPELSIQIYDTLYTRFQKHPPAPEQIPVVFQLATQNRLAGRFSQAREILYEFGPYFNLKENPSHRALQLQILGIIDNQQGLYESAVTQFVKSLAIYDSLQDQRNKAVLLKELGITHERLNMLDKAIDFGKQAVEMIRQTGDSLLYSSFVNDLGVMHQNNGMYEEALVYQTEALGIQERLGKPEDLPFNYHNIGDIYLGLNDLTKARHYLQLGLEGFERIGLHYLTAYSNTALGRVAMQENRNNQAIQHLNRSLAMSREHKIHHQTQSALELLGKIHSQQGNYRTAYDYLAEFKQLSDSLVQAERDLAVAEITERYKNEQVIRENEQLRELDAITQQKLRAQRLGLAAALVAVCIVVLGLIFVRRSEQKTRLLNEELAKSNVRLQQLDEERANLMHVMAHDLKAPLSQIRSISELIREDDDEDPEQMINLIDTAASNGLDVIQQVMTIHQPDQFEKNTASSHTLSGLINDCIGLHEAQARRKQIHITFTGENTASQISVSQCTSLQRLLDNLLSNAVKYSFPSSDIQLDLKVENENAILTLQDGGPGFSEEDKKHLFRKFTRLSARPTGNEPSTGLGLSIAREITEELNGTLRLIDRGKTGACFELSLPVATL